jgi:polyhydroxyalkanoate synthesis regulator phasin
MAQDLKDAVADIKADQALLNEPNLPDEQLFKVVDKIFERDSLVGQRATKILRDSLSQLKAERAELQQQQSIAQRAYNLLTIMLGWDQTSDLAKLNMKIQELEGLLSTL